MFQSYLSGRIQVSTTSTSPAPAVFSNCHSLTGVLKVQCSVRSSSLHTQQTFLIPLLIITFYRPTTCLQTTHRCMTTAWYPISPFSLTISPLVSTTCKSPFPHTVRLQLNATKREFIWFGTRTTLTKYLQHTDHFLWLLAGLSACYYHLRRLRSVLGSNILQSNILIVIYYRWK